jgi:hypothetical protein
MAKMSKKTAKATTSKVTTTKKASAKRKTQYESVQSNIQKITSPTGNVSYRVRVAVEGEKFSVSTKSLNKARIARKELLAA